MPRPTAVLAACVLLLLVAHAGTADARAGDERRGDHDRARAALRAGEILPLSAVLERVARAHPGQVLEVELERDDGRWVYELKILDAEGLARLKVDAGSGETLERRMRRR